MIINFKNSRQIQKEPDSFLIALSKGSLKIHDVTKGAYMQASVRLDPLALKLLNETTINCFYKESRVLVWNTNLNS